MKILTHKSYCKLKDEAAKVPLLEAKINPGCSEYNKMSLNQLKELITDITNEIKKRMAETEKHTHNFYQNNYKL